MMPTVAAVLATLSGLRFVAPAMDAPTLLGTGLVVQVCHGILCRIFAHLNGYPKNLWTALGLIGGVWGVTSPSARTQAIAVRPVWLSVTSQRVMPRARATAAARPWSASVGAPFGRRTTSNSRHATPSAHPVPSAFMAASLAAKRTA